jgi:hypothetical protein
VSWEALTAIASLITAVVIAATAVIAIVQINHLRTANQLSAALSLYREADDAEFRKVRTFVQTKLEERMKDPAYVDELRTGKLDRDVHLEIRLGNYWVSLGLLLRTGLLDRKLFLDWGAPACLSDWKAMRDVTRALRSTRPMIWRDFEYLARLSAMHIDYMDRHPIPQPKWREGLEELDVQRAPATPAGEPRPAPRS